MLKFKKILSSFSLLEKRKKRIFYLVFLDDICLFIRSRKHWVNNSSLNLFLTDSPNNAISEFLNNVNFLKNFTKNEKLEFFIIVFLFFFIVKNTYLVFFRWFQINFTAKLTTNLSVKLFRKYLAQPYLFFVKQKSSKLIRNVMVETTRFSSNVIETYTNLILEILVLITLGLILFIYDPQSFIFVTVISFIVFFLFFFFSKK